MTHRPRLRDESGLTLSEMLVVLVILGIVIGALTQLFTAAMTTQKQQSDRFRAQQDARLALDGLRDEIHCANAVESAQSGGGWPSTAIRINLGSYCSSGSGDVTWCTSAVSANRYALRRVSPALALGSACTGGVVKADYLVTDQVFTGVATGSGLRAKLSVSLPVDLTPATAAGRYELQDDLVLRNSPRTTP